MNFLRNLFYVEVDTPDGPRVVSRFFDYLSIIDYPTRDSTEVEEEEVEDDEGSIITEESIEEEALESEVEEDITLQLSEIREVCSSNDIEDPFVLRDHEHILAKIDALLSNLNGFLQVPETVTGTQPNGTIIKKMNGKVFLSRKQNSYEVGVIIEDQAFRLFASYQE